MADTNKQFDQVTAKCRQIFIDKMKDYGPSWRIFRLYGITDQLYIKACNSEPCRRRYRRKPARDS